MVCSATPELTCRPFNKYKYTRNFYHHKQRLNMLSQIPASNRMKKTFNHSLFKEARYHSLYRTITNKSYKLSNYEQIMILWSLNTLQEHKKRQPSSLRIKHNCNRPYRHKRDISIMTTPPHSNRTRRYGNCVDKNSTNTFDVEHKILAKNHFPASDLEKGWVIDSGASAHMIPFTKDYRDIQPAQRRIFLADGSSVICKEMGKKYITICNGKVNIGSLRLGNVLIVPDLDRRLFSINSFLESENNWVHFENNYIHLGSKEPRGLSIESR